MSTAEKRLDSGRVIITALPPISTDNLDFDDVPELMDKTRAMMTKVFLSTNHEVKMSNGIITNEER